MNAGTSTLLDRPDTTAAQVLARVRSAKAAEERAAAEKLAAVVEWAHLHAVDDEDDVCTLVTEHGEDTGIPVAGPGAPLVSEFAVIELATALGMSHLSGRSFVGQALELAHRLPRVWARVQSGHLPAWRGRRIAEQTTQLSAEAAEFVDRNIAPFAHKIGLAATERLMQDAIGRFMAERAKEIAEQAAEGRYFTIEHEQVSFDGTSRIHGELDLADALDLEDAVAAEAEQLKQLGSEESLDVRRAKAVGEIARTQLALDLTADEPEEAGPGFEARCARTSTDGPKDDADEQAPPVEERGTSVTKPRRTPRRNVMLYVHLAEDALTGSDTEPAEVEHWQGRTVTADTIREWLGVPGTQVTVRPVIDLNRPISSRSYKPPPRLSEQVALRDRHCVFPWCTRPARRCQDDHIVPWQRGGPTSSDNIAKLCTKHHRAKTHDAWRYRMIRPGTYEWTSPMGYGYLVDSDGTIDLTPAPIPGPRAPE